MDKTYAYEMCKVQIISCWFDVMSHVRDESNFLPRHLDRFDDSIWSDWSGLYRRLQEGERIWELKDVISASLAAFGGKRTWSNLFREDLHAADFLEEFLGEWRVDHEYDESTYLAILAILVDLCQNLISNCASPSDGNAITTAKRCLEHARRVATCIRGNDPQNIKSRPYLLWIVVQKELERKLEYFTHGISSNKPAFEFRYLNTLPGFTVWDSALPIYVPIKSESPGWPVLEQPQKSDDLLQIALKASQELGDYRTEVSCLRELICRSSQLKELFERLAYVQKSLQGDMIGYLQTLLSKYLFATDEEARQSLNDELTEFDARQPISYNIGDPIMVWCQRMIQAALYRSSGRFLGETERVEQMAKDLHADLPDDIWSKVSKLGFHSSGEVPRNSTYTSGDTVGAYPSRFGRENERAGPRRELEETRLRIERDKEENRIRKELELKRLREEKQLIKKREAKEIIEKYKLEEAKKKKEAEEKEAEYRTRLASEAQEGKPPQRTETGLSLRSPDSNPVSPTPQQNHEDKKGKGPEEKAQAYEDREAFTNGKSGEAASSGEKIENPAPEQEDPDAPAPKLKKRKITDPMNIYRPRAFDFVLEKISC
jgi:hypothetical protein